MNKWKTILALAVLLALSSLSARADDPAPAQPADEPTVEQGDLPVDEAPLEPAAGEQPVETGEQPVEAPANDGEPQAPSMPTLDEVLAGKGTVREYLPMHFDFRIGLVGEFEQQIPTYDGGTQTQTTSPLILINPSSGSVSIQAKNFPARIVANSPDGQWVIAVAPSAAVEGTSGATSREAAVTLSMVSGEIKLIVEFPLHSNFQALFPDNAKDTILYCVNQPGAVNQIIRYNLQTRAGTPIPADGNRFQLYGLKDDAGGKDTAIWVRDPMSVSDYPVVSLLDMQKGSQLDHVEFPGTTEVLAQPNGETLLASITDRAEASLGYYETAGKSFRQIENLVLTRPQIKWTHKSKAVIVKETTTTRDRFLWVDLKTGEARELFSAYYKIGDWDISPNDDALVFVVDSQNSPILYVLSIDPNQKGMNRIRLRDISDITWLGCLNTPPGSSGGGGKNWLDRLIPRF